MLILIVITPGVQDSKLAKGAINVSPAHDLGTQRADQSVMLAPVVAVHGTGTSGSEYT